MSAHDNLVLAQAFLAKLGSGASPEELAELFTPDLIWDIPGDVGALPWIGRKVGRSAATDFFRDTATMVERVSLDIQDVLASEERAVIVGELKTLINHTGKLIETAFAIILTFAGDKVATYVMLEDSFAVSRAARK
ncbi:nuclear transport factor 2 family protein [Paraburkholderia sp.]|uniref:nuclear transport factor 2 family protein n=1 Tax=Paraburkholderia sp. TaxID=1926495 RepID=UPI003D6EF150